MMEANLIGNWKQRNFGKLIQLTWRSSPIVVYRNSKIYEAGEGGGGGAGAAADQKFFDMQMSGEIREKRGENSDKIGRS